MRTWSDLTAVAKTANTAVRSPQTAFRLPLVPAAESMTLADVAAGKADQQWIRAATALAKTGAKTTIVSIGGSDARAASPQGAQAFQRIATTMKKTAPALVTEWTAPQGKSVTEANATYPGDAVVDVIAIRVHDTGVPWSQVVDGPGGLNAWLDFATAHRKRLVVQWSATATTKASWVQNVHNWIRHASDRLAYEAFEPSSPAATAARAYTRLF